MSLLLSQGWSGSVSVTDGADVLAASVLINVVQFSAAVVDGADALSASVSPLAGFSAAVADGADVLAASVLINVVQFSAAVVDGADVLSASVSPLAGFSAAAVDGADVLSAFAVTSSALFSVDATDGADVISASVNFESPAPTKPPGGDDAPRVEIWEKRKRLRRPKPGAPPAHAPEPEHKPSSLVRQPAAKPAPRHDLAWLLRPQPDWRGQSDALQGIIDQMKAIRSGRELELLERDDEEILLLL